jgi:D-alanyl-D-alanine carboxypeptidase
MIRKKLLTGMGVLVIMLMVLTSGVTGSGCAQENADTVLTRLETMLSEKYSDYKNANGLPENAGILVHLATPKGKWVATAGLPAGADENWHYRIASVSKTFTAASIMLLDQQGKLNIDDVLAANIPGTSVPYLADSPHYDIPYKDDITIRLILEHRAGIFDVFNNPIPDSSSSPYAGQYYGAYVVNELNEPDHTFTADELAGILADNNLSTAPPDTENRYSDTGYNLLAKIVERVSGKSYDRFLNDNFFTPIGLNHTSAPWNGVDVTLPAPFFTGLSSDGTGWFETVEDNMSAQIGPGNITSTPSDISKWIRTLLSGNGPLRKEQVERMMAVPPGNTAYGLGISNTDVGVGHSGAHPGYTNFAAYNPDDDVAVVVVTPFIDYTRLTEHLAFLIDIAKEARNVAGFTGTWEFQ